MSVQFRYCIERSVARPAIEGSARGRRAASPDRPAARRCGHGEGPMTREAAIAGAEAYFDAGGFETDLARRVAIASTSQEEAGRPALRRYLADEIAPSMDALGFSAELVENPEPGGPPFLLAERDRARLGAHPALLCPRRCRARPRRGLARRARPVDADPPRRTALRARHGGQQGPAQRQSRRACRGDRGAGRARLLDEDPVRDGGGGGLARAARALRRRAARDASAPICSSPRTGRASPPTGRRSSSVRVAASRSSSSSICAPAPTIRAIGAARSPTRRPC